MKKGTKMIKLIIGGKLQNIEFVARPCRPTNNKKRKSKDEKEKYEI